MFTQVFKDCDSKSLRKVVIEVGKEGPNGSIKLVVRERMFHFPKCNFEKRLKLRLASAIKTAEKMIDATKKG